MKQSILLISATLLSLPFFIQKPKKVAEKTALKMCYVNRFDADWLASVPFDPAKYALEKPLVRRSVGSMNDTSRMIVDYRKAIAEMRKLPATNPLSWIFQANMHGKKGVSADNKNDQCQHGNDFFLSWHRMYLYFFERIVRQASGDPQFALPFWDYSLPKGDQLPLVFRVPSNSSNPLFTPFRDKRVNDGGRTIAHEFDAAQAFRTNKLLGETTSSFQHEIESFPHGRMHMFVAKDWTNLMGDFATAGQDPIFWLHHCNIDRLWEKWMIQKKQPYPTDNRDWMQHEFLFYDEKGQPVRMTGAQIINTAEQLGYQYNGLDYPKSGPPKVGASGAPKQDSVILTTVQKLEKQKTKSGQTVFNLQKTDAKKSFKRSMGQPPTDYELVLRDIAVEKLEGGAYEVYLNVPNGMELDPENGHFVGYVNLFGLGAKNERRLWATETIQKLREQDIDTGELEVTIFFRKADGDRKKFLKKKAKDSAISVGSVELVEVDE